jgi:hypothetical protein
MVCMAVCVRGLDQMQAQGLDDGNIAFNLQKE